MSNAFDSYLRGKQSAMQQGQQQFAMEQAVQKMQREQGLQNAGAYDPETGMDMNSALNAMYQGGYGREGLALQAQMAASGKSKRDILLKHKLKMDAQNEMIKLLGGKGTGLGGVNLQPGQSVKFGDKGMELTLDPYKAAQSDIAQQKLQYETGLGQPASDGQISPSAPSMPGMSPKMTAELSKLKSSEEIKGTQKRINALRDSASSRKTFLEKANKFKRLFEGKNLEEGEVQMRSGAGRKFAQEWIPGVWTKQGQLSEEFNAFAETAARAALKASGEIRPTDADVKGMKEAMFGTGRDETVNVTLLNDSIKQMELDETEYNQLKGKKTGRRVGRFIIETE